MAETVPETLIKEKQKLIINTSSCEQDNCESVACGLQPNRSKATDNSKRVDNLEELDIKEHGGTTPEKEEEKKIEHNL